MWTEAVAVVGRIMFLKRILCAYKEPVIFVRESAVAARADCFVCDCTDSKACHPRCMSRD